MIYAFEVPMENMQRFSDIANQYGEAHDKRDITSMTPMKNGNMAVVLEADSGPTTYTISRLRELSIGDRE